MGKVGRIIVGAAAIVTGVALIVTGNWSLGAQLAIAGTGIIIGGGQVDLGATNLSSKQGAILENRAGGTLPLPVVYGTTRLAGILADLRVDPNSTDDKRLVLVSALCHGSRDGGDIEGFNKLWLDERLAIDGAVVQSPFSAIADGGDMYLEFSHNLGSDSQVVDARLNALFPTEWPSTSAGAGVAYTALELWFNADLFQGIPTVRVEVEGNRVFDPRTSTWVFSDNPALCIRDYLLSSVYGMGLEESQLDDDSFIDMANYCDELVTDPDGGTMRRFTLNGWVDTSQDVMTNLAQLLTSCRGAVVNEGDRWRMFIRREQPTSGLFIIDEHNTVEGTWQFVLSGARDTPNVARATYVDPNLDYQGDQVQWPAAGAANAFLTEDSNLERRLEITLPFTNERKRAQQIAMTLLKEVRFGDVGAVVGLKESALELRVGDLVEVYQETPGWSGKVFEVAATRLHANSMVDVILTEYDPDAYSLDAQDVTPSVPNTNLPSSRTVAAPTGLTFLSDATTALQTQDGLVVPRILFSWTPSTDPFLDSYEVQVKLSSEAASEWRDAGRPVRDSTSIYVTNVTESTNYDLRIRAVNGIGVVSSWVTLTSQTTGTVPIAIDNGSVGGWDVDGDELASPGGGVRILSAVERVLVGSATAPLTGEGIFLGLDGADYEFRAGDPASDYIHWDGTQLTVVGNIDAVSGTIGGWTIAAEELSAGSPGIKLQATAERILVGAATAPLTGEGIFLGLDGVDYEFRAGDPAGEYIHWDGTSLTISGEVITTDNLQDLAVTSAKIGNYEILPDNMSGESLSNHGVWMNVFERLPSDWVTRTGTGTQSIEDGVGQAGGKAFQLAGYRWMTYPSNIPYDPSKLYRIRCRVRRTATTDALTQLFYCGLEGYAADGVTPVNTSGAASTSGQHYIAAAGEDGSAWTLNEWQEFTGWFKGNSASAGGSGGSPSAPRKLHTDVRYFRPMFIMNHTGGPVGNVMQLDYIVIDVFDEDGLVRSYLGLNVDGVVAADKVVAASIEAGAVTAAKINVTSLSAIDADMGTLTAGKIEVGGIEVNADTERILFGAATAPLTGEGIFLGLDGADYEFRVGDPAGEYIHWDGSNFEIKANAFTGSNPVFDNTITLENAGNRRIVLDNSSNSGIIDFYAFSGAGTLISSIAGGVDMFTPSSGINGIDVFVDDAFAVSVGVSGYSLIVDSTSVDLNGRDLVGVGNMVAPIITSHIDIGLSSSLAAGAQSAVNVTVTGAAVGDVVLVGLNQASDAGLNFVTFYAWVRAADTVRIEAFNHSAISQNLSGLDVITVVFPT